MEGVDNKIEENDDDENGRIIPGQSVRVDILQPTSQAATENNTVDNETEEADNVNVNPLSAPVTKSKELTDQALEQEQNAGDSNLVSQ